MRAEGGYAAPTALYIHVPICASKCRYCDFFSIPSIALPPGREEGLVEAILSRARGLARRFGSESIETIYIGGGTPTLLSAASLNSLLGGLGELASDSGAPLEWTIEANPDSLGQESLDLMAARGVTRLSLGVQSLDADDLELLGRRHGPEPALAALRAAAASGLEVSADLIAGIPRLRGGAKADPGALASFALELAEAGASHISAYDLSLEEGTPLAAAAIAGELLFPSEDEAWEERRLLEAALLERGMRRYEVSNYAAKGKECRHNLAYWRMDSYIGAGPGAVSTIAALDGTALRIEEPRDALGYGGPGAAQAAESEIGIDDCAFERLMMAFRTSFGLDLAAFRKRFGREADQLYGESLGAWSARLVPGERWPSHRSPGPFDVEGAEAALESRGPALDGKGLDLLNRFLVDCLREAERGTGGPR